MGQKWPKFLVPVVMMMVACVDRPQPVTETPQVPQAGPVDSLSMAFVALDQRIVNDPGNPALYAERARLHLARDSARLALLDMERAVALDSSQVDHLLGLGDLQYAARQLDKAQRSFSRALELAPEDNRARLKLAEIELVRYEYKRSMTLVNEALRKDPTAAHGYYLKGWIHMETKDTSLALSSFRTAVEQDPTDFHAYMLLGKLSAAKHDRLAEQYYSTAIELRPKSVEAWYNKGVYFQDHGRDSLALACYERIKEIDPRNATAWYNSGWVRLEHLGDLEQAKKDFSRAIELETNYADAWYNRGVALERTNELDSAAANYQICLSIDRNHMLAATGLGRLAKQGVRIKMLEKDERK